MLPHKTWLHHVSSVKTTCLLSRTLIALSNPTEKKIHMELEATDGELSTQFFRVLTSSNDKIPF